MDHEAVLPASAFGHLLVSLRERGYTVIGPTLRDGAIVYGPVRSPEDLPVGMTDEQGPGWYRLRSRKDGAYFGYAVGPHSWKKFLYPPEQRLWRAVRADPGFELQPEPPPTERYAFLGVRACELAALAIHDRVFLQGQFQDPSYQARRAGAFVVAVQCGQAGGTCFCVSMGTGPRCEAGYDIALTEILDGEHRFYVEVGSPEGAEVLAELPSRPVTDEDRRAADQAVARAAEQMGRKLETAGVRELLLRNLEHPRWDEVAARCLSCGNCTLVCPTCFCSTVEDSTDLRGNVAERRRRWDSCFALDFSYLHGGAVRGTTRSRYRQWLVHKLATWWDQFGTSGCVGCGRCITWCPVGIDLTEEVAAIRSAETCERQEERDEIP